MVKYSCNGLDSSENHINSCELKLHVEFRYKKLSKNISINIDGLKDFLNFEFELPQKYKINVFDCSESAAYVEWILENRGYDTKIVGGPTPWDPKIGLHAQILVVTDDDNYRIVIEPTALTGGVEKYIEGFVKSLEGNARGIVYYDKNNDTSINYYQGYTEIYENIYEAVKDDQSVDDWNWWEGIWGFE